MNDINFKIKLSLNDYRNFNYSFLYSGRKGFITIFITIIFIINTLVLTINGIKNGEIFTFINIFFIILTSFFILLPILLFFQTKKIFITDKFLSEEQNYIINEEGFEVKTNSSNVKISWDRIFLIKENKNYLLIFIAQNKAFIIPKSNIQDKLEAIKELFLKYIIKKKLKIRK